MRSAYRVFAFVIAAEVVVQAAAIAFAVFGLSKWIEDGGTLNKAAMESEPEFTGVVGFMVHGINGTMIVPLLALLFLVVSFFAKVPGGVKWAAFVLLAVVVQVLLGMLSHAAPGLGALHGANALLLFGLAVTAGLRVRRATAGTYTHTAQPAHA